MLFGLLEACVGYFIVSMCVFILVLLMKMFLGMTCLKVKISTITQLIPSLEAVMVQHIQQLQSQLNRGFLHHLWDELITASVCVLVFKLDKF